MEVTKCLCEYVHVYACLCACLFEKEHMYKYILGTMTLLSVLQFSLNTIDS